MSRILFFAVMVFSYILFIKKIWLFAGTLLDELTFFGQVCEVATKTDETMVFKYGTFEIFSGKFALFFFALGAP